VAVVELDAALNRKLQRLRPLGEEALVADGASSSMLRSQEERSMVIYCQLFIVSIGKRVNVVVSVTHQQRKALDGGSEVQVVAGTTSFVSSPTRLESGVSDHLTHRLAIELK